MGASSTSVMNVRAKLRLQVEEAVTIHEGRRQAEYAERVRQIQAEQQANAARAAQGRPTR